MSEKPTQPEAAPAASAELDAAAAEKLAKREAKKAAKAAKIAAAKAKKEAREAAQKAKAAAKAANGGDDDDDNKKKSGKDDIPEFVNTTPAGEKKDLTAEMASSYHPPAVEAAWYAWWQKQGYFTPTAEANGRPKYVIVIPPPNVTGSLHLGHALTNSVQDALVRWRRMKGDDVLWVPGTDHAGIATQRVVEKRMWNDSKQTRHDLGRTDFVKKVWEWKEMYGSKIYNQLRRLGSSLDWTRTAFTMDDNLSAAVTECFVRFFEEGLIYRADRLVNWCCTLETAISDIEVEYIDIEKPVQRKVPGHGDKTYPFGVLDKFAYKVIGGSDDDELVVATTRIETMLGDTAVAVHPDDERYKKYHGKKLKHPFVDREIPIILDSVLVDMNFGTGAVKVTPAHDPNDYATGKRHNLEFINILNRNGTFNENGGEFAGMKRFDVRLAIIGKFKEMGLYRGKEPNPMRLGLCSRSGDVVEPFLTPQWWVDCKDMAAEAVKAVRTGELEIVPAHPHTNTWYHWLENVQDWCISRQLWWGHRIPAYLISIKGDPIPDDAETKNWVSAPTVEEARAKAAKKLGVPEDDVVLTQDEDVLDTWFSSGLFPFSVFGWPRETDDFKRFFPTSVLETGHDILFFWVARMVMMSQKLTGKLPFKQVLLHAMVRDAHNRKMSKSLGNVIDPLHCIEGISLEDLHETLKSGNLGESEIKKAIAGQKADYPKGIPECGTDALRFGLCSYMSQGRSINLDVNRVVAYRHFCNKLWNATRFALTHLEGAEPSPHKTLYDEDTNRTGIENWLLSRLAAATATSENGLASFQLAEATDAAYNFWMHELCAVFLEAIKPWVYIDDSASDEAKARKASVQRTLYTALDMGLRLLHPFMPFVTEELWQRLPHRPDEPAESLMMAAFPDTDVLNKAWSNKQAEEDVKLMNSLADQVRSLRGEYRLTPKQKPTLTVHMTDADEIKRLTPLLETLGELTWTSSVSILDATAGAVKSNTTQACVGVSTSIEVRLTVKGFVNPDALIKTAQTRQKKMQAKRDHLYKSTQTVYYDDKTPDEVKKSNQETLDSFDAQLLAFEKSIKNFEALKQEASDDN